MTYTFDPAVLAFTSDASIDFTPIDFSAPLNIRQQQYLKKHTGRDIPKVIWRKQVHGDGILVVNDKMHDSTCPEADALVTDKINTPIAIRTADCVPVFLYDPVGQVIGIVHAGWKGTQQQIAHKTVMLMKKKFGSKTADIQAALGPSGGVCCYDVGPAFKEYFPEDVVERDGKLYADVAGNNVRQLKATGLLESNIHNTGICTICSPAYFSFRRDGETAGRMISLMILVK